MMVNQVYDRVLHLIMKLSRVSLHLPIYIMNEENNQLSLDHFIFKLNSFI